MTAIALTTAHRPVDSHRAPRIGRMRRATAVVVAASIIATSPLPPRQTRSLR